MTKKKRTASKTSKKRQVTFSCFAPEAQRVCLAGTFNNWDQEAQSMKKAEDGHWSAKVRLVPGRHEYRFIADGHWFSDHEAIETAPNPHGSHNSVIVV